MKLSELICVCAILAILGSMAMPIYSKFGQLKWRLFYIQNFHNGRIAAAVNAENQNYNADVGLEDGNYERMLKLP